MGFIREPKNVDFYTIDKPWSEKDRQEFSALIKRKKERLKKRKNLLSKTGVKKKVS